MISVTEAKIDGNLIRFESFHMLCTLKTYGVHLLQLGDYYVFEFSVYFANESSLFLIINTCI